MPGDRGSAASAIDFQSYDAIPVKRRGAGESEEEVPSMQSFDELRSVIRRHGYEVEQLLALTVSNAPHLQPSELLRLAVQWREARRTSTCGQLPANDRRPDRTAGHPQAGVQEHDGAVARTS